MFTYSLKQQLGRGLKSDSAPLKLPGGKETGGLGGGLNWLMIHTADIINVSAGTALKSEGSFKAIRKVWRIMYVSDFVNLRVFLHVCDCLWTVSCACLLLCERDCVSV